MTYYKIKNIGTMKIHRTPNENLIKGIWIRGGEVLHYTRKTKEELEDKLYKQVKEYLEKDEAYTERHLVKVKGLQLRTSVAKENLSKSYEKSWLEILANTPEKNSGEEK